MMLFTIPNLITLLRLPMALLFLQENTSLRIIAVIIAMLSDAADGFIARRYASTSRFGTFLDPFCDKFFVIVVLGVFLKEQRLLPLEALAMLGRDFAIVIFGFYLAWKKTLPQYQFRTIWCGKITTALQFAVVTSLLFGVAVPVFIYISFAVLGVASLGELYLERKKLRVE